MVRPWNSYRQNGAPSKPRVKDGRFTGTIRLNRSQSWKRAKSYTHAREIGPSSEPVR